MGRSPFPSVISVVLILQCLASDHATSVSANINSLEKIANALSEQLDEFSVIADMKRAFDFDMDTKLKKVLSKARVKYADYDVNAAAGVSVEKQEDPTVYCYYLLEDYSNAVGALMNCVANNSRPLRICTKCVDNVNHVRYKRDALRDETNHWNGSKKCLDALSHKDYLEVVQDVFDASIGKNSIWHRGGCSRCFDNITTGDLSKDTREVFDAYKALDACIKKNHYDTDRKYNESDWGRSEACHVCYDQYEALIEKKDAIKAERRKADPSKYGNYPKMDTGCSDLDDIYNYTALALWTQDFRCYPPKIRLRWTIAALFFGCVVLIAFADQHTMCFPHCRCWSCYLFTQGGFLDEYTEHVQHGDQGVRVEENDVQPEFPGHIPGDHVRFGGDNSGGGGNKNNAAKAKAE